MKFTKRQIVIIFAGIVVIIGLVALYLTVTHKATIGPTITLNVWGVDNAVAMQSLGAAYTALRPNVMVKYTQVAPADYEAQLLKAFAAGDGPDVFEVDDHAVNRWSTALTPLPTSSTALTPTMLNNYFPSVVASDFVGPQHQIYGVPLSIDTLAMFYNKDYFDAAGIALPPTTWDQFDAEVPQLRQVDATGNITRAAVALGATRTSYADANDMISLLMLQNGTAMTSASNNYATFASIQGQAALSFYLQFSNAGSPYYTWNDAMGDALQSFAQGKSAVYFGYYRELATIKAAAPFLNVSIAPMLQPGSSTLPVNYPDYEGLVAAKTGNTAWAWDFILFSTTYAPAANIYLGVAGQPAALRETIATQESDPTLGVFAKQALSAQSWYEGDDQQTNTAFDTMMTSILTGAQDIPTALRTAEDSVTAVMVSH